jgi:hypothetical protein
MNPAVTSGVMLSLSANGSEISDIVVQGLTLDGNNVNNDSIIFSYTKEATSYWPTAAGYLHDVAFIDLVLSSKEGYGTATFTGGGAKERVLFLNVDFDRQHGKSQGLFAAGVEYFSVIGGRFSGGDARLIFDHPIYPSGIYHGLYRWINFDAAYSNNFCINTNAPGKYTLVDGIDCNGLNNGVDWSNANNDQSSYFDEVILQNSAIHDLGNGGQGFGIMGYSVKRISIRDNLLYNLPLGALGIESAMQEPKIYRNKIYQPASMAGAISAPVGTTGFFTDNTIIHMGAAGPYVAAPFAGNWTIDRNQWWIPNYNQAFSDATTGLRHTFAEWQAAGFDVSGSYQNPFWVDPANGNFIVGQGTVTYPIFVTAGSGGSISPVSALVAAGGSQAFTITPSSGYQLSALLVDGVSQGTALSYTFSNVTAQHAISATFSQPTQSPTPSPSPNPTPSPSPSGGTGSVSTTGLLLYYPFDGTAADLGSSGIGGTITGAPQFVAGKVGQALQLNGTDDVVSVQDNWSATNNDYTLSVWTKAANVSQDAHLITTYEGFGDDSIYIRWAYGQWLHNIGCSGVIFADVSSIVDAWHHIVCTRDSVTGATSLYLDGTFVSTATGKVGPLSSQQNNFLKIGSGYNGLVDEARIYNRALSAQEVTTLYANGAAGIAHSAAAPSFFSSILESFKNLFR